MNECHLINRQEREYSATLELSIRNHVRLKIPILFVLFQIWTTVFIKILSLTHAMDEFNSETDSDYTSYWRDWVCAANFLALDLTRLLGQWFCGRGNIAVQSHSFDRGQDRGLEKMSAHLSSLLHTPSRVRAWSIEGEVVAMAIGGLIFAALLPHC